MISILGALEIQDAFIDILVPACAEFDSVNIIKRYRNLATQLEMHASSPRAKPLDTDPVMHLKSRKITAGLNF
jgi:hypothetical protein